MRVAVVGARRVRAGTGPFLARFAHEAGAHVCGVLTTNKRTAKAASLAMTQDLGIATPGFSDWEKLLARTQPDALIIASPATTHEHYLRAALESDLHVYCEKPLLWIDNDMGEVALSLAEEFLARELHLHVGTQWPYTLDAYRSLYPDLELQRATRFRMILSPPANGAGMVRECMSHPLSMLHAVFGDPSEKLSHVVVEHSEPSPSGEPPSIGIAFEYRAGDRVIQCEVLLEEPNDPQMNMGFGFDDSFAYRRRAIDGRFQDATLIDSLGQSVALPDPTPLAMRAFVNAVADAPPKCMHPGAVPIMGLLQQLRLACGE